MTAKKPKKEVDSALEKQVKSIFKSKTFWVNIIAFIAFLCQRQWGFIVDEATQAQILMLINILLRAVTNEPVRWK